jgi:Protein of unknown function (DUF1488)
LKMALSFPNPSRSYDEKRNLIRFWGYDSSLEIAFLVEVGALYKLQPQKGHLEADSLGAFDAVREQVLEAAHRAYARGRPGPYLLAAADL